MIKRTMKRIFAPVAAVALAFSFGISAFAQTPDIDFIDVSHHNSNSGKLSIQLGVLFLLGTKAILGRPQRVDEMG